MFNDTTLLIIFVLAFGAANFWVGRQFGRGERED